MFIYYFCVVFATLICGVTVYSRYSSRKAQPEESLGCFATVCAIAAFIIALIGSQMDHNGKTGKKEEIKPTTKSNYETYPRATKRSFSY